MKAVLYRFVGGAANKYEKVTLSDFAVTLAVIGDYVTVRAGGDVMAAVKLGEHDHVRL